MSKKLFLIILVLSVVVTYGVSITSDLISGSIIAGNSGFPFKFASGSLFGEGSTNYLMLILDIIFWFVVIWVVWKLIMKQLKR